MLRFSNKDILRRLEPATYTAQKMKFSIKDFSKCDQIRSFLRTGLHLLKKSLMENLIFCVVLSKARNSGTLFKMNPSQVKTCNFTKARNPQLYKKRFPQV